MPDEHNPQENPKEGNQTSKIPSQPTNTTNTDPAKNGGQQDVEKWWKESINWPHVLQAVGIVIGIGVAWIYWGQLHEMILQTSLASEQANRAVIADAGNAAASRSQLALLQDQVKTSQDSAKALQNQFEMEQRPQIAINDISLSDMKTDALLRQPVKGEPVVVTISFINTGHSPALGIHPHYHMVFASNERTIRAEAADKIDMYGGSLDPGTNGNHVTVISLKDTFSRESAALNPVDEIGWDGTPVMIFGRISYADRFRKVYCLPYIRELSETGDWIIVEGLKGPPKFMASSLCPAGTQNGI